MQSKFRRALFIKIGIIAGVSLFLILVTLWLKSDISSQASRIVQDRAVARERSAAINILASLKSDAPIVAGYKDRLNAYLPSQEQLLDFPATLRNLARIRQATINFAFQGGQVLPSESAPGYIGFGLDISGKEGDVLGFLKDMEFEPPRFFVAFDTFDFTNLGENYRLITSGKVFFQ